MPTAVGDFTCAPQWLLDAMASGDVEYSGEELFAVMTLEGKMTGNSGDYIILGVAGEIYPCKREIFEATYDPAGDPA